MGEPDKAPRGGVSFDSKYLQIPQLEGGDGRGVDHEFLKARLNKAKQKLVGGGATTGAPPGTAMDGSDPFDPPEGDVIASSSISPSPSLAAEPLETGTVMKPLTLPPQARAGGAKVAPATDGTEVKKKVKKRKVKAKASGTTSASTHRPLLALPGVVEASSDTTMTSLQMQLALRAISSHFIGCQAEGEAQAEGEEGSWSPVSCDPYQGIGPGRTEEGSEKEERESWKAKGRSSTSQRNFRDLRRRSRRLRTFGLSKGFKQRGVLSRGSSSERGLRERRAEDGATSAQTRVEETWLSDGDLAQPCPESTGPELQGGAGPRLGGGPHPRGESKQLLQHCGQADVGQRVESEAGASPPSLSSGYAEARGAVSPGQLALGQVHGHPPIGGRPELDHGQAPRPLAVRGG